MSKLLSIHILRVRSGQADEKKSKKDTRAYTRDFVKYKADKKLWQNACSAKHIQKGEDLESETAVTDRGRMPNMIEKQLGA